MTSYTSRRIERLEATAPKADDGRRLDFTVLSEGEHGRLEDYSRRLHADKEARGLAEWDYDTTSPLSDEEKHDYGKILSRLLEMNRGTA